MSLEDDERSELMSRQIADRVTESVESSLRRRYSWIGLVTAFVLGGVGYGLITAVVKDANESVLRAQVLLDDSEQKLERIDALADRSREQLGSLEEDMRATQARLEDRAKEIDELLSARRQDVDNLGRTAQQIEELWASVRDLNERLAETGLTSPESTSGAGEMAEDASSWKERIDRLAEENAYVQERIATSRTTVYLQVARLSSEAAEAVTTALSNAGYSVPDPQLVRGVPGQQVRYFHSADRSAAEAVGQAASDALKASGASDAVIDVVDLTDWPQKKPREGTVELWLGR
ncbi:hypothetical protein H0Z60_19210 [Ectothiorhodospiraceae bacterium WFHF3C12]|nr:hypothetical protein [Ectothiorhodospiraceae bacterium WFHF3C12]